MRSKNWPTEITLVIWVDPHYPVSLNYTCRYCKNCDLLIAHQNEIENLLVQIFRDHNSQFIGNDYTVLGTMEKPARKQGVQKPLEFQDMAAYQHDFNQVLRFELTSNLRDQELESTRAVIPPDVKQKGSQAGREELPAQVSVDDVPKAMALLEKMKLALPITVRPTKDLVIAIRKQGMQLDRYRDV